MAASRDAADRGRARHTSVIVDGLHVACDEVHPPEPPVGSAPIVLLHGGLVGNETWHAQLAGLGAHHTVIAPERPGHGATPDRPVPFTYEAMAAQMAGFLRAFSRGSAHLVGWSDGGMVGLLIAHDHPELVRTLSVTGTGYASHGYVPGSIEALCALPVDDPELAAAAQAHAQVSPDGPDHFPVLWSKIRQLWSQPFDWSSPVSEISVPTLVIVGDDDYVTVSHAQQLAHRVADGRLAVVPGASHMAPAEKPELFNSLILDVIDQPSVPTQMPLRRQRLEP